MVSIHLFLALAAFSIVDAATTVAVLEFGKSGSVRRTLSSNSGTTVAGATSFFQSLSGKGLQHSDMTMVPDLFHKPDGVVIVEISGAGGNLHSMPVVSELLSNEGKNHVVGHMTLPGSNHHSALMNRVGPAKKSECSSFVSDIKKEATTPALSVVSIHADSSNAAEIDSKIAGMMSALQQQASSQGTIVVHLVVEEDEISAHRRLSEAVSSNNSEKSARRKAANQNDEQDANGDANGQYNNAYNGYGYYNDNGEWVTPFKTMFQIQYFNIVLWTSVTLVVTVFFVIYLVVNMPLEADTLLFGESAKIGD